MTKYETLHVLIKDAWTNIVEFKDDKSKFNEEFMQFVPELKKYIAARITSSVNKGKLPDNKYKVADFLDELFINAYDNIERYDSSEAYYVWLIQQLDELLEDTSIEEEFNEFFFQNIDKYTHEEWDAMEEEYSMGINGKYMLLEEFEGGSYPTHEYTLKDVFIDNSAQGLIDKISDKLDKEQIQRHIGLIVNELPVEQRTVFQQSVLLGSNLAQIAQVRSAEAHKVEDSLKTTRLTIQGSFETRFNI
ncbi:MAG: hypothetical protein GQ574_24910 [Crocinitomix sp.]|nr:hypothetical protein [Crocinitomix sp.]